MPLILTIPIAFVLGFSLSRVATCTVAATARLVVERRSDWLIGLLLVAAWSGLTMAALGAVTEQIHLPAALPIGWTVFAGGAVMGIGALINRACFVGTVAYIGQGRLSYLATFAGLGVTLWAIHHLGSGLFPPPEPLPRTALGQSIVKQGVLIGFALVGSIGAWRLIRHRDWPMGWLALVGVSGGLIFASSPEWAYGAVINNVINGDGLAAGDIIEFAVAALFGGAVLSAVLKGRFALQFDGMAASAMHFIGGMLMGVGAAWVPGGNDVLLLWTIPGMALYGLIAYLVMIAVIAAAMVIGKRLGGGAG